MILYYSSFTLLRTYRVFVIARPFIFFPRFLLFLSSFPSKLAKTTFEG